VDPARPNGFWSRAALAVREPAAALALFTTGALFYLGPPMHWRLAGSLGPDQGDPLLYVYLLKWFARGLASGFAGYWDPPFFHPLEGVLAFSDHLIGPGVAFAALRALGLPALAAYNLLYASQFVAAGLALWWVLRRLGVSFAAAALGGWFFAFGHFRWDEGSHFNVLLIAALPLVLWSFDRLLEAPSARRAALFLACYLVHLSGGTYLAYLVHVPLAILAMARARALLALVRIEPRRLVPLVAAAALAALPLAFLYLGYSTRTQELRAERDLRELRESSSVLASFVTASRNSSLDRLAPWSPAPNGRGALFPGFTVGLLAATSLVAGWRRLRRPIVRRSPVALAAACLGATLVLFALIAADRFTLGAGQLWGLDLHGYRVPVGIAFVGAALLWAAQRSLRAGPLAAWERLDPRARGILASSAIAFLLCLPAFYWLLWSALPAMRGTRVSHRFFAFAAVGIALLAARGFDLLQRSTTRRAIRALLAVALGAAVILECAPRLRAWAPLADEESFPAYAHVLAETPDVAAYLQLPIFGDWRDLRTMYFGTNHWRPLVNGSTSFEPRHYGQLVRDCSGLEPGCLDFLRRYGVSHVVLVEPERDRARLRQADAEARFWRAQSAVRRELAKGVLLEVHADASSRVYRLLPMRETSEPEVPGEAISGSPPAIEAEAPPAIAPAPAR
jgi:hypothetical protein